MNACGAQRNQSQSYFEIYVYRYNFNTSKILISCRKSLLKMPTLPFRSFYGIHFEQTMYLLERNQNIIE